MAKRVLFVSSEIYPYVKTGGLGDVSSALPLALKKEGCDVRLFLPGYPAVLKDLRGRADLVTYKDWFGLGQARVILGKLSNGMMAYVLDAPGFYDRSHPYIDAQGNDWADNHRRFGAFCRAAADIDLYDRNWRPDIIHGNDWQTGLIPAYLAHRGGDRPATALTIHNLAYQGLFPAETLPELGLPPESFGVNGLEYHGRVGFLKAGLYYADKLTTVSPTYAREIMTPEYGCGLDGLLRSRAGDLTGILNGIDQDKWNPVTDPYLANHYDASHLAMKTRNKETLLRKFGMALTGNPVFAVIGRLTHQKGFDLLLPVIPRLIREKASIIFMGQGDAVLERKVAELARRYPGQVGAHIGYDEAMEHQLHGGSDAVIMPSRFEPCGLVQMYGLRYGTIPVVRRTGGLADTVEDTGLRRFNGEGTGLTFDDAATGKLENALMRTLRLYRNGNLWNRIQRNAMAKDFSWKAAANRYDTLYADMKRGAVH